MIWKSRYRHYSIHPNSITVWSILRPSNWHCEFGPASVNTHHGTVVKLWINNQGIPLKQWLRQDCLTAQQRIKFALLYSTIV